MIEVSDCYVRPVTPEVDFILVRLSARRYAVGQYGGPTVAVACGNGLVVSVARQHEFAIVTPPLRRDEAIAEIERLRRQRRDRLEASKRVEG